MKKLSLLCCGLLGMDLVFAELPEPVFPAGVGVNIHFTTGHERDLDLIAQAGLGMVRMDFGWGGIERVKGEYDWSAYDSLTTELEKRGLKALYILDYSNRLYEETVVTRNPINGAEHRDVASPQHPESVAAFARWAGLAAARYKGRAVIWEIWNEPNITFWKPQPNAEQYLALALATCQAVRAADPKAAIVAPATSGFPWDFMEKLFQGGLLDHLDGVSVHPYRNYQRAPETAVADYDKLRELIAKYGATPQKKRLPILNGEWGYASHTKGVSLAVQADFVVRQQLINFWQQLPVSIWYDWKNDGMDPDEREHHFGIVQHDLAPKPAYLALTLLLHELKGAKHPQRLALPGTNDYALAFTLPGGPEKLAVWTAGTNHTVALGHFAAGATVQARGTDGKTEELKAGPAGVEVELTGTPKILSRPRR